MGATGRHGVPCRPEAACGAVGDAGPKSPVPHPIRRCAGRRAMSASQGNVKRGVPWVEVLEASPLPFLGFRLCCRPLLVWSPRTNNAVNIFEEEERPR